MSPYLMDAPARPGRGEVGDAADRGEQVDPVGRETELNDRSGMIEVGARNPQARERGTKLRQGTP
jgi:hypothetical protein